MGDWWERAVIYQVYPRSFRDSDGDGVGDLRGLLGRLDHQRWLGVDAIWLCPIYRSPLADVGYDVCDHTAIAPQLGTDADFDQLIAQCHRRGLKVLLDLVASHTSIEHPWFRDRPDLYVLRDRVPNNWVASFGGPAWSPDPLRPGSYYLHSFFPEQPDLDWRNPAVREEMAGVIRHWAERGVDGFRVDAVDRLVKDRELRDDPIGREPFPLPTHPDAQRLALIHSRDSPEIGLALAALREAAGELPLFGEVYLPDARAARYRDYLDRTFSFDLLHARPDATELAGVLRRAAGRPGQAWATSNHDFSRVASRWGERKVAAAAALLLTLPGCAFLYQGEELGMRDGSLGQPPVDRFGRDAFRSPMRWEPGPGAGFTEGEPWLPLAPAPEGSVAEQRADPGSTLALFRELIALRGELEGELAAIEARGGVLGYQRGRHRVRINLGDRPAPVPELAGAEILISRGLGAGGELAAGGCAVATLEHPSAEVSPSAPSG